MTGGYPNLRIEYGCMYRGALRLRMNVIQHQGGLANFGKNFLRLDISTDASKTSYYT